MPELFLEVRGQQDRTVRHGSMMMTPPVGQDYWRYRVRLSDKQAIVGFPKFGTISIGFAVEEDWNANLSYATAAEEIYEHIEHNKGDDAIGREDCIRAIEMVQGAALMDAP